MSSDPIERLHLWERPHVVYLAIAYGISWPLWIGSWLITQSMDAGDQLFNADLVWAVFFEGDRLSAAGWLSLLSLLTVYGPMIGGLVATPRPGSLNYRSTPTHSPCRCRRSLVQLGLRDSPARGRSRSVHRGIDDRHDH